MGSRLLALSIALTCALEARVFAQCNAWSHDFGYPGISGGAYAMLVHDDGSGPELFVASSGQYAGATSIYGLGKWNGTRWAPVGAVSGTTSAYNIYALASFDDGTGSALYAGGAFSSVGGVVADRVAKWNGSTWSALGTGLQVSVNALEPYDDGNGPKLYAAGNIYSAGGVSVQNVVVWNGASWTQVGSGLSGGYVSDLQTYDDGTGAKLYATGGFTNSGGAPRSFIAAWDGSTWTDVGGGLDGGGTQLAVFDDGAGPELYVSGQFANAGGVASDNFARWNGSSWSAVASLPKFASSLHVFDDGTGSALYAGFTFTNNGGVVTSRVRRFRGGAWSVIQGGPMNHSVFSLASYDAGGGGKLFVGGDFNSAGGTGARCFTQWTGSGWSTVGGQGGWQATIHALAVYDAGTGPQLYAGGEFNMLGSAVTTGIAAFDGLKWNEVDRGVVATAQGQPIVHALASADLGNGSALYVGGEFEKVGGVTAKRIAKWDGAQWSALGSGIADFQVNAVCVYDSGTGPNLYVGGDFTSAGGVSAHCIARWNGTSWSAVGGGLCCSTAVVRALVVHDDGSGPQLYVGGDFSSAGGVSAYGVARWNGTTWSAVPGSPSDVQALASFADAQGPALYAASVPSLSRFRSGTWTSLNNANGAGVFVDVHSLTPSIDAGEPALYAAGVMSNSSGATQYAMRWNGSVWSSLDFVNVPGMQPVEPEALAICDTGSGARLYVGGRFDNAGAQPSFDIAARELCAPLSDTFCPGNGGAQACPCGGSNAPGAGCANSTGIGAVLANVGIGASVHFDDAVLGATHLPPNRITVFAGSPFQVGVGTTFYAGLMCLAPPRTRLAITSSDAQGGASFANVASSIAGLGAGTTWNFQVVYRDAPLAGCAGTLNTTNGIAIRFMP
jgi:hypothetical protein